MTSRRSWSGLEATLFDAPAGPTRSGPSPSHRLGFHVGRPVRATCRFDGRTHRRLQSRGDIDLVPAGLAGLWEDDRPTRILSLQVSPALLRTAAIGVGLDPDRVELTPRFQLRDPRLEQVAWAFEAELEADAPADPLYGDSLALALAVHLLRRYRIAGGAIEEPTGGLSRPQLARVTDYIEAHLDRPLSLAELAGVAAVSASHFKTLFKRSTGSPVHQYVVRRRVERARLRLTDRGASLPEVAREAGFSDPSHMARWMRRVLGTAPASLLQRGR